MKYYKKYLHDEIKQLYFKHFAYLQIQDKIISGEFDSSFLNNIIIQDAIIKEITTLIEIIEDIWGTFYLSFNLRSRIFIKLQKNSGGYWDNKKFKDYFQINC